MNYFDTALAATLYAKGRPYFHEQVMQLVQERLNLTEPVNDAVDVGSGTGLSTRALRQIARHVVGVDVSAAMIAQAETTDGVTYRVGTAENLPVESAAFDLLTVSSAFHWLDPVLFWNEAGRVLRPNGFVILYENGFRGELHEGEAFSDWVRDVHLARFPTPPRGRTFRVDDTPPNWTLLDGLPYENAVPMTQEQLTDYLLTQSNVVALVEKASNPDSELEAVRAWLGRELAPFFAPDTHNKKSVTRHALFRGVVWILQPEASNGNAVTPG